MLEKEKKSSELMSHVVVLLLIYTGISVGMCHAIHRYTNVNNKYMKDYDPSIKLSHLLYWDANNLYKSVISQKFAVDGSNWRKDKLLFNEEFIGGF